MPPDNNFMRRYQQRKVEELASRLCVILLFLAFVGAMLTHQPPAIVAVLFIAFSAIFTTCWYPAIQNSADCEHERLTRLSSAALPSPIVTAATLPKSAEHPVSSPPPRTPPEN